MMKKYYMNPQYMKEKLFLYIFLSIIASIWNTIGLVEVITEQTFHFTTENLIVLLLSNFMLAISFLIVFIMYKKKSIEIVDKKSPIAIAQIYAPFADEESNASKLSSSPIDSTETYPLTAAYNIATSIAIKVKKP